MKKMLLVASIASLFISALAFSSPTLVKTHKGMNKDGAAVDCAYCHKTSAIPKEGKDFAKYQKNATCAGPACHK